MDNVEKIVLSRLIDILFLNKNIQNTNICTALRTLEISIKTLQILVFLKFFSFDSKNSFYFAYQKLSKTFNIFIKNCAIFKPAHKFDLTRSHLKLMHKVS